MNITGLNFQPDFAWIKSRSAATDHAVYDSVRGVQKRWETNQPDYEVTSDGGVTAFNSDGVTLGTLAQVNTNAATYVMWAMKKAAACGMDIVSYTGTGANRTISHSLGIAPEMIIIKERTGPTAGYNSIVYHSYMHSTPGVYFMRLTTTDARANDTTAWNSTVPTSSVFSLGSLVGVNENTATYVAYLFAGIEGFSKFGSYLGNGSTEGPFVYCGFRPRWVMFRRADSTGNWSIKDALRPGHNSTDSDSRANTANAELTGIRAVDLLSNGFKIRTTDSDQNVSAGIYIFAAFAESPFKYSRAR